jgi:solute carrier family 12 (sodium/potassium/chloride transporter), member 2
MAKLLNKLRIDYSSLIMVQGISEQPEDSTIAMHNQLLEGFMEDERDDECSVLHTELAALQTKTYRQLRLRELLKEHSLQANMVIMSLPMPRQVRNIIVFGFWVVIGKFFFLFFQGTVSAPLYMSWLEMLTRDMPPMLLVRGNQTSVLTFYS